MKRAPLILLVLFTPTLSGLPASGLAQAVENPQPAAGQYAPLDNEILSARDAGMGGAFTAVAEDDAALLSNPAGLGFLKTGLAALHSHFWLAQAFQETAVLEMPLGRAGGFGIAATDLDFGTLEGRDEAGDVTAGYGARRWSFEAGWGWAWGQEGAAGLAVRESQETIAGFSNSSFTLDGGILLGPWGGVRLGADFSNTGWGPVGSTPGSRLNLGLSELETLNSDLSLLSAVAGAVEPNGVQSVDGGMELAFEARYFVRAGYQAALSDNGTGGLSGLSLGAGIGLGGFTLDYAYVPYGTLGDSHRFSLIVPFEAGGAISRLSSDAARDLGKAPRPLDQAPAGEGAGNSHLTVQFELPTRLFTQAQAAESRGLNQQALALYEEIVAKDPLDLQAWWALGNLHYRLGHRDNALRCFEEILKVQPDNKPLSDWLERYKAQPF